MIASNHLYSNTKLVPSNLAVIIRVEIIFLVNNIVSTFLC